MSNKEQLLARVYYQRYFYKFDGEMGLPLTIFPEQSVFIVQFCYDPEQWRTSEKEGFCDSIFNKLNNCPTGHSQESHFLKVGHTLMSVGDYIIFEDGEIWISNNCGWKVLAVVDKKVKV